MKKKIIFTKDDIKVLIRAYELINQFRGELDYKIDNKFSAYTFLSDIYMYSVSIHKDPAYISRYQLDIEIEDEKEKDKEEK